MKSEKGIKQKFRDLSLQDPAIVGAFEAALLHLDKDNYAAATSARSCLEFTLKDIFVRVHGEEPKKGSIAEMMRSSQLKKAVPVEIYTAMDFVRQVGNIGAHRNGTLSSYFLETALEFTFFFLEWNLVEQQSILEKKNDQELKGAMDAKIRIAIDNIRKGEYLKGVNAIKKAGNNLSRAVMPWLALGYLKIGEERKLHQLLNLAKQSATKLPLSGVDTDPLNGFSRRVRVTKLQKKIDEISHDYPSAAVLYDQLLKNIDDLNVLDKLTDTCVSYCKETALGDDFLITRLILRGDYGKAYSSIQTNISEGQLSDWNLISAALLVDHDRSNASPVLILNDLLELSMTEEARLVILDLYDKYASPSDYSFVLELSNELESSALSLYCFKKELEFHPANADHALRSAELKGPESALTCAMKGLKCISSKNLESAELYLRKANTKSPGNYSIALIYFNFLIRIDRTEKAHRVLNRIAKSVSPSDYLNYVLASSLFSLGKVQDGLTFKNTLVNRILFDKLSYAQAMAFFKIDDVEQSSLSLQHFLKISPSSFAAVKPLLKTLLNKGELLKSFRTIDIPELQKDESAAKYRIDIFNLIEKVVQNHADKLTSAQKEAISKVECRVVEDKKLLVANN